MNMERIYIVYDVVKKDWIIEIMTINKIHKKSSSVKYMAHISISFCELQRENYNLYINLYDIF